MLKNVALWFGYAVSGFAILSGGGGMCLSLLHMSCAEMQDIIVGGMCFIAGAVLVGSGVIGVAVLSLTTALVMRDAKPSPDAKPSRERESES